MYDNVCKYLAEHFSSDFARWILGTATPLTTLSPAELSLEPIRADALILLQSEQVVLHLEFQTQPAPTLPFRMADYRLRVYRRFPHKRMRQVVVYLRETQTDLVYQTVFAIDGLRHEYEVMRLWQQPTDVFFQSPGLLPFAVLSQTSDPTQTLRQVAEAIETLDNQQARHDVAASSAVLAGLVLERAAIRQVLRSDIMRESVIYQDILAEGKRKGRQEGRQEGEAALILRLLPRRVGELPQEVRDRVAKLPVEQLEELGEALLDFTNFVDLEAWLRALPQDLSSKQNPT